MKKSTALLLLSVGVVALAGCEPNRTLTGGLLGAGVGTTVAGPGGAVVGSSVGAMLGARLDRQFRELQSGLAGSGATVVNTGNTLVVTLPEQVTFDTGSSVLHPDYVDEIAFIARSLRDNPDSTVVVIGHTDNTGGTEYNQRLSERRAASVALVLTNNGVSANRVHTVGRGYTAPIASNDTPGGRAQNRRVEIIITPTNPA